MDPLGPASSLVDDSVIRVLSINSAQTGLDAEDWGMNERYSS